MIIDFHTHIFPREVRNNRNAFFSDEPAFKLLYASSKSRMAGAKDIITMMDEQHVDLSVIFGFPWKNPETITRHNDYIIEAVNRYPDRLIGFCCLDVHAINAEYETQRCIENGLAGVGELAFYQEGIDQNAIDALQPIMALCQENNLPIMIHTNEPVGHNYPGKTPNTLKQIYNLVRRYPDNKIVLAHWGGGLFFFSLLKKEVKASLKNVYFDTAASPFLYDAEIYRVALTIMGPEKILFGSDYPLISPTRYIKEVSSLGISQSDTDAMFGNNASHLLNVFSLEKRR